MDRKTAIFVDGVGAGAAPSGILSQLQGRIWALLYLERSPLSLDDIAAELQQSKSNISTTIRGLIEWHLVRRVSVPGSRKDYYEAATDFWRVMQEIFERRFRWMVRQILVSVDETQRLAQDDSGKDASESAFVQERLNAMREFFLTLDACITAFAQGEPITADWLKSLPRVPVSPKSTSGSKNDAAG